MVRARMEAPSHPALVCGAGFRGGGGQQSGYRGECGQERLIPHPPPGGDSYPVVAAAPSWLSPTETCPQLQEPLSPQPHLFPGGHRQWLGVGTGRGV